MKKLTIIWLILCANMAFADSLKITTTSVISDQPDTAALDIMQNALSSLQQLKQQKQANFANVEQLIKEKLLPNIAANVAAELSLKTHWSKLTEPQKTLFQRYIINSLIDDYGRILTVYDSDLDGINIKILSGLKRKNNKAIVKLNIRLSKGSKGYNISLKMIKTPSWKIYDVVFSGVSLIKNYQAQFDSHIKRKGLDSLIKKLTKKLKKDV